MKVRGLTILMFLLAAVLALPSQAQNRNRDRKASGFTPYFSLGANLGSAKYVGDLDDDFALKFAKWGVGLSARFHFHPHLSVRATFLQGEIGATDEVSGDFARNWRNLHFKSNLTEGSLQLVYEFFGTRRHYRHRPFFTPYVFTGLAVFHFNPKAQPDPEWVDAYPSLFEDYETYVELQPLRTEGQGLQELMDPSLRDDYPTEPYSRTQLSIPVGIGVRFALNRFLNIGIETGFRKTFTDYLDDVSNIYAPPDALAEFDTRSFLFGDRSGYTDFGNPDLNRANSGFQVAQEAGEVRGFTEQDDWYIFTAFTIEFIIDKRDRCPRF